MKNAFPLWIPAMLGKEVSLLVEFVGPCETYGVGSVGRLMGIMVDDDEFAHSYAIVALDDQDISYLENFEFDQIRPVGQEVKMSVDMEEGVLVF